MRDRDSGYASRVLDFALGILLAAMALYGAVEVVSTIWVTLCIIMFVAVLMLAIIWYVVARFRRF